MPLCKESLILIVHKNLMKWMDKEENLMLKETICNKAIMGGGERKRNCV